MYQIDKFFERLARFCRYLMSDRHKLHHKYQNKNQILNSELMLKSLKLKNFYPKNIVDVGCGHGEWAKKMIKHYSNSMFYLFDANEENKDKLEILKKKNKRIYYQICLLADNIQEYEFYKMGYGSSIFEEQTTHKREIRKIKSKKLSNELPKELSMSNNNMIKLDAQGSELKILNGLDNLINNFEVIILETSIHKFNKDAPLFNEIISFMLDKNYQLYDLFDFKRIGYDKSFLLQFDCVFIRKDSNLLNVNFG